MNGEIYWADKSSGKMKLRILGYTRYWNEEKFFLKKFKFIFNLWCNTSYWNFQDFR